MKDIMKKLEQIREEAKNKIHNLKPVALVGTTDKKERKNRDRIKEKRELESEEEVEEIVEKTENTGGNIFNMDKFEIDESLLRPK